ncbi:hypothetical protein [Pengzhenrongella phosphoraccumulans]|uniref:hypothetical protein n=1 Tax=Pengzhenrongella phosphoraccumulans TaxID=3114394 RepID=UPI0038909BF3
MRPITSRVLATTNQVVIAALKSKAGPRLGRRLAVIEYRGHRTGRRRCLVAQYINDGKSVRIRAGMADRKTWWRNFEEPHPIGLLLAGVDYELMACVARDGDGAVTVVAELGPLADVRASGEELPS